MVTHRRISTFAALVILGGSAYLATPATAVAEPIPCSDQEWYAAAQRANDACEGPASFAGYCDSSGNFVITDIYCRSQT